MILSNSSLAWPLLRSLVLPSTKLCEVCNRSHGCQASFPKAGRLHLQLGPLAITSLLFPMVSWTPVRLNLVPNSVVTYSSHCFVLDSEVWNPLCKEIDGESLRYNDLYDDLYDDLYSKGLHWVFCHCKRWTCTNSVCSGQWTTP